MKSINQIFKNNKHLLEFKEVQELIVYCESLEDDLIENKQNNSFSKEDELSVLIKEIYSSINSFIEDEKEYERYHEIEKPDYKEGMLNLKSYLNEWSRNNKFYFD